MNKYIFTFVSMLVGLSFSSSLSGATLSIERIFSSPDLNGSSPMGLRFSPNGERLSFLRAKADNYEVLDLWEYDLKTGEPKLLVDSNSLKFGELSEAEKSRRERMRIQNKGIVEYFWSNDGKKIVFPAGGNLFLYDLSGKLQPITKKNAAETDVKFSPKDRFVSFVRGQDLFLLETASNKEFRATSGGKGAVSNATAEFIAQEEMDRFTGYWWSDDEKFIAYTQVDESPVKEVDRYDIQADSVVVRKQRYPEAGSANAIVKLIVVKTDDVKTKNFTAQGVPLGSNKDIYFADAGWTKSGKLFYQIQSRDQKTLECFLYDPIKRVTKKILTETDSHWVNLSSSWRWLKESPRLIWSSERSGFRHLYLYSEDGEMLKALTKGDWPIDSLVGVDEESDWVYFTSGKKNPLEKQLYRVALENPGEPEMLTKTDGYNEVGMNKLGSVFLRIYSAPLVPPQLALFKANGDLLATLSRNEVKEGHPLFIYQDTLVAPEFGSFKGPSGDTLHYRVYKPKNFDAKKKYPMVVTGYGGPHTQVVGKFWGGKSELFAEVLASKGFVVASIDNRGSARRGKKFEDHLYRAFGTVEVEDQAAGIEHLISQGYVDSKRIGFFGWSYGGYLSLALALKKPDLFRANVSVAPVLDFALYDTHYTERYMGKPKEEVEAYKRANNLELVSSLKAKLLIMHGMADDNVLFTNTTLLFKQLQKAGKIYESITYPGAKHGISGKENQTHVYRTITDFFERNL